MTTFLPCAPGTAVRSKYSRRAGWGGDSVTASRASAMLAPTVTATAPSRICVRTGGQVSFLKPGSLSSTMATITVTSVSTINWVIATSSAPNTRKISAVEMPTTPSAQIASSRDRVRIVTIADAVTSAAIDQSRNVASGRRTGQTTASLAHSVTARLDPRVANTISR